ncbi:MAG: hypothetical protein IKS93_03670 [Methanobrevibacter sp.]|nr:hypothetical protein [Methanobrevibacter sp.]
MIKYENKEPKAVGCVYLLGEHNHYNDSDFYAQYIDVEKGTFEYEEYDTTRFGGGGYATLDLDFEHLNKFWEKAKPILSEAVKESLFREAGEITKGKLVVVNRGRKVPHGTSGEVFWLKKVNYDPYQRAWGWKTKIGLKDDVGNVYWTYADNVDVVSPENYVNEDMVEPRLKRQYDNLFDIACKLRKDEDKEVLKKEFYRF